MRVLLVGVTGFVGKHLRSRLEEDGYDVIAYTRGMDLSLVDCDATINCAGELDSEANMVAANVELPIALLEHAKQHGVSRFIQVGSSSELGPKEGPRAEGDACHPSNLYEATKLAATTSCISYAQRYGLDICVARPFTLYGPEDKPRKMLPTLWRVFQEGKPFTCYFGGHDWTAISDFVDGLVLLLGAPKEKTQGQIYHFGTGISTSNEEIVRLFERAAGSLYRVDYVKDKLRPYDVMDWRADNTKAKTELGWEPKITVEQGIKDYIMHEWFNQDRGIGL